MARFGLVCFVLAEILLIQAMADKSGGSGFNPFGVEAQSGSEPNGLVAKLADQPASGPAESSDDDLTKEAEAPEIRRLGKHHSSEKSVAGGGVIIGGLVTAIFAVVFAYIRVTRKAAGVDH